MQSISPDTPVLSLVESYPFLLEFLASYNPRFRLLRNPMMRATAGRLATVEKAARVGGLEVGELLDAIRGEVERQAGMADEERPGKEELKTLIRDLHNGLAPDVARDRFDRVIRDVSPQELGAMEEDLIREGLPVAEIQRLCDLHVSVVRGALDRGEDVNAPPGHPAHTCLAENRVITELANRLGDLSSRVHEGLPTGLEATESEETAWRRDTISLLDRLSGIHNHYLRKENELFPVLERHGITGPSQVMWGVHDDIRAQLKGVREALESDSVDAAAAAGASLARAVVEMVYKEERILLPLAMETLDHEEWAAIRRGEDELGYAFSDPAGPFPPAAPDPGAPPRPGIALPIVSAAPAASLPDRDDAYLDLGTGRLSLEQVDMLLRHLPVDLSFVDSDGYVRYYSETEDRLFPRTPGAIGRHVTNCHPPKSVHMVEGILRAFSSGERNVAEFWIQMKGRFIHIRYIAVRNGEGTYLGCLEVSQDVTGIRALEGERRLLEWSRG